MKLKSENKNKTNSHHYDEMMMTNDDTIKYKTTFLKISNYLNGLRLNDNINYQFNLDLVYHY